MIWQSPWALIGLLALPIIWWLHRHRRKPEIVALPTLMFLLEEDERVHQPRKRRLDLETALAMLGAVLLAMAAAGPFLQQGAPVKRVRVVVSGGAPAHAIGYEEALQPVLRRIRATGAEVTIVRSPRRAAGDAVVRRPSWDSLFADARAGSASVRIIISDQLPAVIPGDLQVVALDQPAGNVGIVGLRLVEDRGRPAAFVSVMRDPPAAGTVRVRAAGVGQVDVDVGEDGYGSAVLALPDPVPGSVTLTIADEGTAPRTGLLADREATIQIAPLGVAIHPGLPPATTRVLRRGLRAALGSALRDGDALRVASAGAQGDLLVGAVADGASTRSAPRGVAVRLEDPLIADLDPAGVEWVYADGDEDLADDEQLLLGVRSGGATWPIVTRRADGTVRFAPDPSRGDPAPADAPIWPLFLANLVSDRGDFGVRYVGLLDARSSRLGPDVRTFDPAWVAAAKADVPAQGIALRTPLLVFALLVLGVLWLVPVLRRRLAVTPQPA